MQLRSVSLVSFLLGQFLITLGVHAQSSGDSQAVGTTLVDFATSCDAAVTSEFNRAVELLHSFEYPESEEIFRSILESDPECGMARWGVAMNLWHSTWVPPSVTDLETGQAMLTSIDRSTVTAREAAYIDALTLFYTDFQMLSHQARAQAYKEGMRQAYMRNLDDPEAAVFYALSLLATADPKDKSYTNQFESAGLLNWVRDTQPPQQ